MNSRSYQQGFTRRELVVALALVFIVGTCFTIYILRILDRGEPLRAVSTAGTARNIYSLLTTWAEDHDGEFPTARQYSNEAFRELFKAGLVDEGSEKLFSIRGDAWHKNSPSGDGKGADNIIGAAPDFAQALQRGECAYTYVTGLNLASSSTLPLLANGFTESLGVYTDNKSHKGGIFKGIKCAYVTVGGSAKVGHLSGDFRILEWKNGKKTDVFSKEWSTNPDDIKNPEG